MRIHGDYDLGEFAYDMDIAEARSLILKAAGLLYAVDRMPCFPEVGPIIHTLRDIAGKAIPDLETRRKTQLERTQGDKTIEPLTSEPNTFKTMHEAMDFSVSDHSTQP